MCTATTGVANMSRFPLRNPLATLRDLYRAARALPEALRSMPAPPTDEVLRGENAAWMGRYRDEVREESVKQLLWQRMSDLSEEHHCAGWLIGTGYDLWAMTMHGRSLRWGMGRVEQSAIDDLRRLSDACGGWWVWEEDDSDVTFILRDEMERRWQAQREQSGRYAEPAITETEVVVDSLVASVLASQPIECVTLPALPIDPDAEALVEGYVVPRLMHSRKLATERDKLAEKLSACERELERWKRGTQIEGDYICEDGDVVRDPRDVLRSFARELEDACDERGDVALREYVEKLWPRMYAAAKGGE